VLETLRAELPSVRWLALSVSDAAEDVIAGHPRRRPRVRHQEHLRAGLRTPVARGRRRATSCSARGWPGSCSTPSPRRTPSARSPRTRPPTPAWTCSAPASAEVMQLLARGYTYREIGSRLFISVKTVESHASNVLRKLQLSNRNELTRWAATNRLL
jgi:DNA-binding NarL/FixJ family response regulator